MAEISSFRAFAGYVWKIHSRCNLNCSYCYMYNLADKGWVDQPKMMTLETARCAARRMRDHCLRHGRSRINIAMHGGEPLLVGPARLASLIAAIRDTLAPADIRANITIQSNGLLFDDAFGRLLRDRGVTIGISLDGPPTVNDRYRVDHRGRPSSSRLERRLRQISADYSDVFAGLLCVVNPDSDPAETLAYLESFRPPTINFLLPLDNHDRPPAGRSPSEPTAYGDWLCRAFDCWAASPVPTKVLLFNSIINLLGGRAALTESLGLVPADLVVIETNGDIEAVDSLKSTFEGAARLGLNVRDNDLDEAAAYLAAKSRQMGLAELSAACRQCPILGVCGGGDLPTRYSRDRGFDNPSVYCADLQKIIGHIDRVLAAQIGAGREAAAAVPAAGTK
jgi:uncharacterized protein